MSIKTIFNSYNSMRRSLLDYRFTLSLCVAFLSLTSCSQYKKISYFQDVDHLNGINTSAVQEITFRPKDRLSIVVNCKDPQLSGLFNLPFVTQRIMGSGDQNSLAEEETGQISSYTIDTDGNIDFPTIGKIHVAGLTRNELAVLIKDEIESRNQAKDPVVIVDFLNLNFTLMGEVRNPGVYGIYKDQLTLVEAIGYGGDFTIDGRRDNVLVLRMEDGKQKSYRVNMNSIQNVVQSPVYYLQQDDVIYVEPTKTRAKQATVNGNRLRSVSFWVSVGSLGASVASIVLSNKKNKNK